MKDKVSRRKPKPLKKGGGRVETYTLSEAKAYLGRLVKKSASGITIYIEAKGKRFVLQSVREIEPIPIHPIGYFQLDAEDIALDRKFSAANVVPQPDAE